MGQQQLLFVISIIIIVSIATVSAINVFGASFQSTNQDAVRRDIMAIATAAQMWYLKSEIIGGGNNSFAGMTFRDINFSAEGIDFVGGNAINVNGIYNISSISQSKGTIMDTFVVTAYPSSDENFSDDLSNPRAKFPLYARVCKSDVAWGKAAAPENCSDSR